MIRVKLKDGRHGTKELIAMNDKAFQMVTFTPLMDRHGVAAALRLLADNIERDNNLN